ncbi:MAG TPA: efflux RND transporter permease subunit [Longimicrobiales bacterium]|jgi:CzcA family heavy metal efflux pump|nr:efflux RND transporter permease subunit [Longimicrobiales bacterium]
MLDALIRWSIRNRLLVVAASALLLVAGTITATRMPVDVFPDLTAPTVTVLTEAHGMAPEEVETLVTFPLETAVNGATGVRRVRSSTSQGISIVWVEFEWGTDIYRARQIVNEKLQLASAGLPGGAGPPVLAPISSIMGEIMLVAVTGDDRVSEMELRSMADWTIRRRLLAVPGVSQVIPLGGEVRQYQVQVDPTRLPPYGLTLQDVLHAAAGSNVNASGGVYQDGGQEYLIRGTGRVGGIEDIAQTVVATRNGTPILIEDVAEVRIGPGVQIGRGSASARPAVILSVQKQPDTNTLELTERIDETLGEIDATLPEGMTINRGIFRQANFIETAVENVLEALRDGAFLVVLILFLFLWSFRTTFISVMAIPLSLVSAVFALELLGITINTMTLGGMAIAIGALVDDAVIDVENVFRRLRENRQLPPEDRLPADEIIFRGSKEIRASIITATFIISIVFVPLFFLSGIEGRMLRPLGLAYIVAIMSSLVVALTLTPALAAYLLPQSKAMDTDEESWVARNLKAAYARTLGPVLRHPVLVMGGAGALVVAALAMVPTLGRSFLPEFQEGTLVVSTVSIPGTSLDQSDALGRRMEEIMLEHPAVVETARRTGRAELDEHAQGANAAEIDVRLDLEGYDYDVVVEELRLELGAVPGTQITIGQPIGHRIDHMLSGTRASIAVKLFGPDLRELRSLAARIETVVAGVEGTADVSAEQQADVPQIRIAMNRAAMARWGVTPAHLGEAIDVAFAGEAVSQVLENQRSYDLVVRYAESYRGSLDAIRTARISAPDGTQVPLSSLAEIRRDAGPNMISRENVQRKLVVQSNVAGRDVGSVVEEIRERILAEVPMPDGYYVEYGGQFESAEQATRRIALLSLLSLALILLLLYLEFGSVRQSLLVMVNLPLALVGGVFAIVLTGGVLNIATLVGFITLFGIAVRNGILMVSHYNHLLAEGATLEDAVWRGSMERLNPIFMTALTAGLALVPLALAGGEPGNEIQSPLAVVVLGGLLTSLVLNMVVVPVLFARWGLRPTRSAPS